MVLPDPAALLPQPDQLPCSLVTVDADGLVLAVNAPLQRWLGHTAQALCGQRIDTLLTVAGRVVYQSYLLPLLRLHGQVQEFALSLKAADGSAHDALLYASTRSDAGRGMAVIDLVLVPIRQRRRLEDEMLRVKRAADELPDMIFQLLRQPDGRSHFPYVSEAVRHLYASTPQQALASAEAVFGRVPEPDRQQLDDSLRSAVQSGGPWRAVYRVLQPDGGLAWHELSASLRQLAGDVTLWHGHVADVTERRQMAQALAQKDAAEQANLAKSAFLARVSHELRTPLNGLLGFAHLLATQDADNLRPEQRQRLAILRGAGDNLLQLINDVLDITSMEMRQLRLNPEPVDLPALVDQVLPLVADAAARAGVRLLPPQLPLGHRVQADPLRLQQVLSNLLTNAVKYNRPGGTVQLQAGRADDALWLAVSDTGIGMSAEQQRRLFEPFNRLGAEHSRVEGRGLGLAITQQLVLLMGGRIEVDSAPGRGTTMRVHLPAALTTPPAVPAAALAPALPGASGQVLYVEDNPVNTALMEAILGLRPGVVLRSAETGAHGLALAAELVPALLLIDMNLPDTDGATLLQAMRQHPALAAVPAVAVSANAAEQDLSRAEHAGFAAYWAKPLQVDQVLAAIDRLLPPAP